MSAILTASRPIRLLPLELANQIAAGEVVERPSSVVKELLENSLDAGATRIEITIQQGGLQSIQVRDNGWGISRSDLPLAISRHATSKISSLTELENIASLGFRGEALASIASVSRMQLMSRCHDGDEAWQLDCASDDLAIDPASHPQGTSIYVHDLFYNTPARRKFMRTEKTEFRHIDEVIRRMALSHFAVGFTFKHNDRIVYQLAPAETEITRNKRIAKLCGKAFIDNALQFDFNSRGMRLSGWLTSPEFSRSQNDLQYFYVNGRVIRDRLIMHAIRQVYQPLLHPGRHAAYVLHLEIEPAAVDVNVHPTKHEVRFREARMVHDFIHRSLRDALSGNIQSGMTDNHLQTTVYPQQHYSPSVIAEAGILSNESTTGAMFLLQGQYIITKQNGKLVIIDAIKARRLLIRQKLMQAFEQGEIPNRPLLIPKSISVQTSQAELVEKFDPELRTLGFAISRSGPESIMLRKLPVQLAGADIQKIVESLLGQLAGINRMNLSKWHITSIEELAEVASKTQTIETEAVALSRLLSEIESLNDASVKRCLDKRDICTLFGKSE